jgi:FkbM family methyltransferase
MNGQYWNIKSFSSQFEKAVSLFNEIHETKISQLRKEFEIWKETTAPDGVVIYGAGGMGRVIHGFFEKLGVRTNAFVDTSPQKQGGDLLGSPVLSVKGAVKNFKELPCIIAIDISERKKEYFNISQVLYEAGFSRVLHYQFLRQYMLLTGYTILDNYLIHPAEDILSSYDDILRVSEMLYDDFSREIMYKIIRSRLIDPNIPVECWHSEKGIYFQRDVFRMLSDEVIIDGGAYNGDTLKAFHSLYPDKLREWNAYEPLHENIEAIQSLCNTFDSDFKRKVRLHECVLGNTNTPAVFRTNNLGTHGGRVAGSAEEGFNASLGIPSDILSVPTSRVDDEHYENEPTFIKLDVEGAETDVLMGAENTIRSSNPLVAVSIYHNSTDLWKLPVLMKEYMPGARFIIRCNHPFYDAVLYVVPEKRWL